MTGEPSQPLLAVCCVVDQTEARNATARMDDEPGRALPERAMDDRGVVAREQPGPA
jgi:hypothetical protein